MTNHRIGLIADTHVPEAGPHLPDGVYTALAGCERILHCGDLHSLDVVDWLERIAPTVVTRGNGDTATPRIRRPGVRDDTRVVDDLVFEVNGFVIGMTHDLSHLEHRADARVAELLEKRFGAPIDIALSGHTHVPMVWGLEGGCALANPGSPTMPHGYFGVTGTVGVLEVGERSFAITIVDVATGLPTLELAGPGAHPKTSGLRPSDGR